MLLEGFSLRNYRSFVDEVTIGLRPLTLLFGYNNSGKSALMRALPLLADSVPGRVGVPLTLESPAARGSSFQDLLTSSTLSPPRSLHVGLSGTMPESTGFGGHYDFRWKLRDIPEQRRQVVEAFEIVGQEGIILSLKWCMNDEFGFSTEHYELYSVESFQQSGPISLSLSFEGLLPIFPRDFSQFRDLDQQTWSRIQACVAYLKLRVQWVGAVRVPPPRLGFYPPTPPQGLTANGENVLELLAHDRLAGGKVLQAVSKWYEEVVGRRLEIKEEGDRIRCLLQPLGSPLSANLVDSGEGLVQVLPVLVAAAMGMGSDDKKPGIVAIEEPESHLHPKLHGALAQYFCKLATGKQSPYLFLETHSESLLLQIQIEVVAGRLDPSQVIVYWVRQLADGRSVLDCIEFDRLGRPQGNWPSGVFSADIEQAKILVQARREQMRPV